MRHVNYTLKPATIDNAKPREKAYALTDGDGFRPDVMMYIVDALKTFKRLGPNGTRMLALEIAVLGRSGLDINDSTAKYKLKALPGQFSGLHLLSMMCAAFQQLDPSANVGADFKAEYDAARNMQAK